jgi:ABC-type polysaccharide/polyol phosphate export permease
VVLLLTIITLTGIGLLSSAFVIAFKQQEPFTSALLAASFLLSGILYPTSVLPSALAYLAPLLPMTHAVALSRGLLIEGASVESLALHFLALAAFGLLLPVGIAALSLAFTYAKRSGSLAHY